MLRCVHQEFPEIATYHGKRDDPIPDHPSGQAIDIMIDSAVPKYRSKEGVALGDAVVAYLQEHKTDLRVDTIIWRQRSWRVTRADDQWKPMKDLGDDNANHFNHIHVLALASGEEPRGGDPTVVEEHPPPETGPTAPETVTEAPPDSNDVSDRDGDGVVDDEDDCPRDVGPMSNAGCPPPVAEVTITSDPSGAQVEFGIQTVNLVVTPGTGRPVGPTPITVELRPGDIVDDSPRVACCQLYFELQYANCQSTSATIGISKDAVTEGRKLAYHYNLNC